jgi:signal peptidase I
MVEQRRRISAWLKAHGVPTRLVAEVAETAALTLVIFLVIHTGFRTFQVQGPSMEPGLHSGEYLAVATFAYWFSSPHRGDVIILYHHHMPVDALDLADGCTIDPNTGGQYMTCDFVKRVIAVPGDTIQIKPNSVIVDGVTLHEPYVVVPPGEDENQATSGAQKLGTNEYWVMGDNRVNSSDSRYFGAVPRNDIIGPAFMVFLPLNNLHWLPGYSGVFAGVKG